MIEFSSVTKYFDHKNQRKLILQDASCVIPSQRSIALLGKSGSGKSVVIKMIGGSMFPNSGSVRTNEKISWPVGFRGALIQNLTANENIEFICLLMHASRNKKKHVREFVTEFCELDKYMNMPVKTYSSGMKTRLMFALCFAFDFDSYMIDEFGIYSDSVLAAKADGILEAKRAKSRLIVVSKSLNTIKKYCDSGLLIKDNKLHFFENIDEAVEQYRKMFSNSSSAFADDSH